jgi:hypothetical protein
VTPDLLAQLGLAAGGAMATGLRVYGTAAALGWLHRLDVLTLPPGLTVLAATPILALVTVLTVAEVMADKVPAFDSLWDAIHGFVRVPAAVLLGFAALGDVSEPWRAAAALLSGGVALSVHGLKASTRLAVNTSPEPFSNWGVSLGEDLSTAGLLWLAVTHPFVVLAIAAGALLAGALLFAWIVRSLRRLLGRTRAPERHASASAPEVPR